MQRFCAGAAPAPPADTSRGPCRTGESGRQQPAHGGRQALESLSRNYQLCARHERPVRRKKHGVQLIASLVVAVITRRCCTTATAARDRCERLSFPLAHCVRGEKPHGQDHQRALIALCVRRSGAGERSKASRAPAVDFPSPASPSGPGGLYAAPEWARTRRAQEVCCERVPATEPTSHDVYRKTPSVRRG